MKLEELVRRTLCLGAEVPVTDADGPGALPGWDSLGHVRLLSAVEAAYSLRLDVRDIAKIKRLSDIKDALRARGVTGF